MSCTTTGVFIDTIDVVFRKLAGLVTRLLGYDRLDEGHDVDGVKKVQADEPLRVFERARQFSDGERRSVGC